jgi:hypothetical protein
METTKFSSDHEMFVQIFQLSCSLENRIYVRVYRKVSEFNVVSFFIMFYLRVRSILRFAEVVYSSVEI